jgi:hypothetical protein
MGRPNVTGTPLTLISERVLMALKARFDIDSMEKMLLALLYETRNDALILC